MPHTLTHSQTSEYRATQLVSSIKHKLSHTIAKSPQLSVCCQDQTFSLKIVTIVPFAYFDFIDIVTFSAYFHIGSKAYDVG